MLLAKVLNLFIEASSFHHQPPKIEKECRGSFGPQAIAKPLSTVSHCPVTASSHACSELYLSLAIMFRPAVPKLIFYHTEESNVYPAMDLSCLSRHPSRIAHQGVWGGC